MDYTQKVIDAFKSPKNMGEISDADAVGKVGNPVCGDLMWLYLKIRRNRDGRDYIYDVKAKTFGCVAAIATSSVMTELIKGKTIDEAEKIKKDDIIKVLGGLPEQKVHCSLLAIEALEDAIRKWKLENKKNIELNKKNKRAN
ncbi:iron-sulfur cluster assembly scaffold protein [Candidatus Woesearchaeota archaeon]|nr:iron-sulfur cluster assembly scaffold protein [Candidatus Woesearchaeota archaeon]